MKLLSLATLVVLAGQSAAQTLTLEQALATARENRKGVLSSVLAIQSARHSARELSTLPGLTLAAGHSTREGLGATDQDLFLGQGIDVFGKTSASRQVGSALIKEAEAAARSTQLSVQTEVLNAFFQAVTAQRLDLVARELLLVAESLHRATVRRFEEGKVPEVQVTRAGIELDRARQAAVLRQSQLQTANKRLAGAMGVESLPGLLDEGATLPAPTAGQQSNPEIMALQARVDMANAEARVASRSNLPDLEVQGLRTPWRDSPAYGARLQLTWRVFDFGKSAQGAAAAKKKADSTVAQLEDLRSRTATELAAIETEIAAAESRYRSYQSIRTAAVDLVQKSQRGYSEGLTNFLDVLEATRSLREVEQELAEAQLSLNLAIVAQYLTGGTLLEVGK